MRWKNICKPKTLEGIGVRTWGILIGYCWGNGFSVSLSREILWLRVIKSLYDILNVGESGIVSMVG